MIFSLFKAQVYSPALLAAVACWTKPPEGGGFFSP